ncbi:MAG: iron-sulfur cluster assembly accessory protein [Nanoarchaeota archaeon]
MARLVEKELIHKDMTIGDAVKAYPQVANVFLKFGLHCVGCHVAYWETIEQGCRGHGMDERIMAKMIDEANRVVEETKKEIKEGEEVHVSDSAFGRIKEVIDEQKEKGLFFRIEVVEGGCSGMSYNFMLDSKDKEDDFVLEKKGVKVAIDKKTRYLLKGAKIDWVETVQGSAFKINNPNANNECGCGNPFS